MRTHFISFKGPVASASDVLLMLLETENFETPGSWYIKYQYKCYYGQQQIVNFRPKDSSKSVKTITLPKYQGDSQLGQNSKKKKLNDSIAVQNTNWVTCIFILCPWYPKENQYRFFNALHRNWLLRQQNNVLIGFHKLRIIACGQGAPWMISYGHCSEYLDVDFLWWRQFISMGIYNTVLWYVCVYHR